MRGEVLHYDEAQGFGFIGGADGKNYSFRREDMRRAEVLALGASVEFEAMGGEAKGVFPVRAMGQSTPSPSSLTRATLSPPLPSSPMPVAAGSSQHYGRYAEAPTHGSTSLWGYFWRGLTVNYATFRGRARRKEYWGYFLFWTLGLVVLISAALAIDAGIGNLNNSGVPIVMVVVIVLFMFGTILPAIAMAIRRLHDIGLSGWLYLVVFIPYVGSLILFVFSVIPTQMHENKWGPVPDGIRIPPPYVPTVTPTTS